MNHTSPSNNLMVKHYLCDKYIMYVRVCTDELAIWGKIVITEATLNFPLQQTYTIKL